MASVLAEIIIDCQDPERVARFWGDVLGWPVIHDERGFYWSSATGDHTAPPFLAFVPVPEKKQAKNRLHIDVAPSGCDQDEELKRLLALGATRAEVGQGGDEPWVVLADPEGNEFCLLGRRVG